MTDLAYWLALYRTPGIGNQTFLSLLDTFGSPKAIFEQLKNLKSVVKLPQKSLDYLLNPPWDDIQKDLDWQQPPLKHIITLQHPDYPPLLKEIASPPPLLFVYGEKNILSLAQIAIVGSRNPTQSGKRSATEFAKHLSHGGLLITSGLALGIDAAAHRGTLSANNATIAVTGTGLNHIYPARHEQLAHQIVEQGGALVSEFLPNTPAKRENFPRRNRLISGLSLGTLVIEAAKHSGSLITARIAAEQGREVFAIPGSIHNPLSKGCHALIRQGAKLVESVDDIFEELNQLRSLTLCNNPSIPQATAESVALDSECHHVLNCIGFEPTQIDLLVERSGLTVEKISSMLLVLELQGYIETLPGGSYSRVKNEGFSNERKHT